MHERRRRGSPSRRTPGRSRARRRTSRRPARRWRRGRGQRAALERPSAPTLQRRALGGVTAGDAAVTATSARSPVRRDAVAACGAERRRAPASGPSRRGTPVRAGVDGEQRRAASASPAVNTPIGVSVGSCTALQRGHARRRPGRRDDDDQPEALARVALDGHRAARSARLDPGEQVQRLGGDVGAAQVGAVGRDEPGRQPGAVGAVHEAGGGRRRPARSASSRVAAPCAGRAGRAR